MRGLDSGFLCIGHRGAAGLVAENTLPSFERALALGVDAVELDVHCCGDALVVIHDEELARTTNGRGPVAATPLPALRALDAGDGAPVPLLEEVLDLVGDRCAVNIELKGTGTAEPVVSLLRRRNAEPDRVLLSAFDHRELVRAAECAPQFPRAALFKPGARGVVAAAEAVGAVSANLHRRSAGAARVAELAGRGLPVLAYTVNDPAEALALRDAGVRGIFTDRPDRILAALGRLAP